MTTLNLSKGLFARALKLAIASYLAITLTAVLHCSRCLMVVSLP